jgi:hypothetical protein
LSPHLSATRCLDGDGDARPCFKASQDALWRFGCRPCEARPAFASNEGAYVVNLPNKRVVQRRDDDGWEVRAPEAQRAAPPRLRQRRLRAPTAPARSCAMTEAANCKCAGRTARSASRTRSPRNDRRLRATEPGPDRRVTQSDPRSLVSRLVHEHVVLAVRRRRLTLHPASRLVSSLTRAEPRLGRNTELTTRRRGPLDDGGHAGRR